MPLLSKLISMLERVVSKLDPHGSTARQLPPRSTSYLLSTLPTGLTCTQLSQEEAALQSSFMKQEDVSKLSANLFETVCNHQLVLSHFLQDFLYNCSILFSRTSKQSSFMATSTKTPSIHFLQLQHILQERWVNSNRLYERLTSVTMVTR